MEKGGHFDVEQPELSPGQWDLTFMEVDMRAQALLFKTIAVEEKEYCSNFRTVPDGFNALAEAADMLTKQVIIAANR